jgi:hypothetical protein
MNIKQGLKLKNKLVLQVNENYQKVSTYNSVEEGTKKPYDTREALEEYNSSVNELVALKTKIHRANAPVYDKIFRLSELKSTAAKLKFLNCHEGKSTSQRSRFVDVTAPPVMMVAEIGIVERDNIVKYIESQIEDIQEILDNHNAVTEI